MGGEDTHHLVQGVAQKAVLVEDEEPALPFLQQNTQELGGFWPASSCGAPAPDRPAAKACWQHSFQCWGRGGGRAGSRQPGLEQREAPTTQQVSSY